VSGLRRRRRAPDPFAALGLTAQPDLTDDDVRAAWRRVAAATHPDRQDGGDLARFAAAAAAYTELRTRFGRGEALAEAESGRRSIRLRRGKAGTSHDAGEPPAGTRDGRATADPGAAKPAVTTSGGRAVTDPGAARPPGRTGLGRRIADTGTGASAPGGRAPATEGSVKAGFSLRLPVAIARLAARVRRGRPARLALRVLGTAAASAAAAAVAGTQPAGPALITGAVTWLMLTARHDLAPPAG
jgi:curved DNA-binding protein CbpA